MKIGNFIVRVFEDGKRLDLGKDVSKTLPLLPIISGGLYDPRAYRTNRAKVIPETGDMRKSRIFAINFLIDLFEQVPQKTILERYDIRLTPYGHIDDSRISKTSKFANTSLLYPRAQEYFLVHVNGKAYLTGENFGQIFIPIGAESVLFSQEKHKRSGSIELAFASALLANAGINKDGATSISLNGTHRVVGRDEFVTSYMDLRSRFILTGGNMTDFPQLLDNLKASGWLDYPEVDVLQDGTRKHLPNPSATIHKKKVFSWHPEMEV